MNASAQILRLLICFALKEEAAPFRKIAAAKLTRISQINTDFLIRENSCSPCQKSGISILLTGIGRQNAEKSVRGFLAANLPELVLTCGFAGGLHPDFKLGDVVFELSNRRDELHESPSKSEVGDSCNSSLRETLLAAGAKPVKFFSAERIASTVVEKKKLRAETGADAVEMESAAIQAVCREFGIPCATVRVISDTAGEDLPLDFNALSKPDKNLDYGKLFLAIAKSPGKIGAMMQLRKKTKFAAEQLARVLAKITFP
jgi:adenosylhomocysteine nucleosidase